MNLLASHVEGIQGWLDSFYPTRSGRPRRARVGRFGQHVVVERFPLPDQYLPDEVDVMLLVDSFPSLPPIGLYLLNAGSESVVKQLKTRFNAFRNGAHYDAIPLEGYTWICFHYNHNQWRVNAQAPNRGDNLRKFLMAFFAAAGA